MMDSDQQSIFSIQESFLEVLHSWWWLVGFMLIGSLAGWIYTRIQPVVYESRASINFRVDYVRTGAISDVREDALLSWPEDIFYSPEVVGQVLSLASQRGSQISADQFREISSLERQDTRWAMTVRSTSSVEAALLVNDWAGVSESVFKEALAHSIVVDSLRRFQDGLVSCLEQTELMISCPYGSMKELQDELSLATTRIDAEVELARGASSAIQMTGIQAAEGNGKPVGYIHNQVIFGGAMLGGILGVVLIETKWLKPRRSTRLVP